MEQWQLCKFKKPPAYKRIEIMDKKGKKHFGFYDDQNKLWMTSYGKKIIKDAWKWRSLPKPNVIDLWSSFKLFPAFGRIATWFD